MIRRLTRLAALGLVLYAITLAGVFFQGDRMIERHGDGRSVTGGHDAAIVLGAGVRRDGLITPSSKRRVAVGVTLLQAGKVSRLILSGGKGQDGSKLSAAAMADYAVSLGAPWDALLLDSRALTTFQNIHLSQAIADEHDLRSLILVTDGLHLTRAKLLAELLGMKLSGISASDIRAGHSFRTYAPYYMREALAWWYNLGKAAVWSGLGWLGWSTEERADIVY